MVLVEATYCHHEDVIVANGEEQSVRIASTSLEYQLMHIQIDFGRFWSQAISAGIHCEFLTGVVERIGPSVGTLLRSLDDVL